MRKKTFAKRPPHEKIFKSLTKPSTRSHDRTFTPSPSPPTSPPRCDPMARTKNPSRVTPSAKKTPQTKEPPSKPGSSKLSSSKGKRPATPEPLPESTQPKSRSVPSRSQRGKTRVPLKSVKEPDIGPFDHKAHFLTSHSNYNPYRFKSAMNNDFYEGVIQGGSVKQNKGPTRYERVILDDEDDDFIAEDSPGPSTEGTSISAGKKSTLLNVVKDVAQEFVS
ncbi:extensin-like [Arachis ipaensis]|uniref:extensin-like n=1 Tax=Arachis ipaensis TaxID=130454 RepID=UPI0007AF7329|nr:extensin-like [Arachis ipaensis]XP_025669988.1 extensin-like [Arachis hypogaea]